MRRRFTALRMHWGKGCQARSLDDHRTATSAEGWLVAERARTRDDVETKYYFSNLPAETPLAELAAAVRSRWPIEQFYKDAKQTCGLGDFQGRRWDGLHRHVALVMLSYSFLALTRWRAGPAVPTLPEVHRRVVLALLIGLAAWRAQTGPPPVPPEAPFTLLGRARGYQRRATGRAGTNPERGERASSEHAKPPVRSGERPSATPEGHVRESDGSYTRADGERRVALQLKMHPDDKRALKTQAAAAGLSPAEYVAALVREDGK